MLQRIWSQDQSRLTFLHAFYFLKVREMSPPSLWLLIDKNNALYLWLTFVFVFNLLLWYIRANKITLSTSMFIYQLFKFKDFFVLSFFLAHLNQSFSFSNHLSFIAFPSVRPSVCEILYFYFFSRTSVQTFFKLDIKHPHGRGKCQIKEQNPFLKGG